MKQQQQMAQMADSAGKIGGVKEDSLVGRALSNLPGMQPGGQNGQRRAP
jgi:hypothetical protein